MKVEELREKAREYSKTLTETDLLAFKTERALAARCVGEDDEGNLFFNPLDDITDKWVEWVTGIREEVECLGPNAP